MQQRQLRLGDILDDYCPRERRVTNHAVVAMIGPDVKQTRCTTCDADHEYKHARVPRQRKKSDAPAALYSQVLASGPKRVAHEPAAIDDETIESQVVPETGQSSEAPHAPQTLNELVSTKVVEEQRAAESAPTEDATVNEDEHDDDAEADQIEEGPVHRPLIRATLPRLEGQPPPTRPAPDFTIRQPGSRPSRFRPRHQQGGQPFGGGSNGNTSGGRGNPGGPGRSMRGGAPRQDPGRPPQGAMTSRLARRHGRKRSK